MFQFSGFASLRILYLQYSGLPHSDICGSIRMCRSPQLFAAYHVLHRLWEPRHSPYALTLLIVLFCSFNEFTITKNLFKYVDKSTRMKKFLIEKIAFLVFLISQYVNERLWSKSTYMKPLGISRSISNNQISYQAVCFSECCLHNHPQTPILKNF